MLKTLEEIKMSRDQTAAEIRAISNVIVNMQERKSIPEAAARIGFEEYMLMLMSKKATLEVVVDTLNWVMGED